MRVGGCCIEFFCRGSRGVKITRLYPSVLESNCGVGEN